MSNTDGFATMKTRPVHSPAAKPSWRVGLGRLPGSIWALGLTSMFMDVSSELVHSLLPIYMSSVLGASMFTIGLVEGIAEATASIARRTAAEFLFTCAPCASSGAAIG